MQNHWYLARLIVTTSVCQFENSHSEGHASCHESQNCRSTIDRRTLRSRFRKEHYNNSSKNKKKKTATNTIILIPYITCYLTAAASLLTALERLDPPITSTSTRTPNTNKITKYNTVIHNSNSRRRFKRERKKNPE